MSTSAILGLLRWLAPLALLAGAWWWHSGQVGSARAAGEQDGRAAVQAEWDRAKEIQRQAADKAREENQLKKEANDARVITAQSTRAQVVTRDSAAVRGLAAERDGLRRDLATALDTIRSCGLSPATADAAAHRAAAVDAVLADMESQGAAMAGAASGHAADSLMYQRAWPD